MGAVKLSPALRRSRKQWQNSHFIKLKLRAAAKAVGAAKACIIHDAPLPIDAGKLSRIQTQLWKLSEEAAKIEDNIRRKHHAARD